MAKKFSFSHTFHTEILGVIYAEGNRFLEQILRVDCGYEA
jgi:predicted glycosyl hydrolase (DUF1957 family)